MANKSYQEQMRNSYPNHPIIKPIPPSMAKTYGEGIQVLPSPMEIREIMRAIPKGKVMTAIELCDALAKKHKVDIACPYTVGILMNIVAKAIEEDESDDTPWWRTLGTKGELKPIYPNAPDEQLALLESEGLSFKIKGKKNIYYVLR